MLRFFGYNRFTMPITTEQQAQIRSLISITQQQLDFFESLDESIMSTLKMLFIVELEYISEVLLNFQNNLNQRADIQKRLSLLAKQLEKTIENRRIIQMNAIHFRQYKENITLLQLRRLTKFFSAKKQAIHAKLSLPSIIKHLTELSESMAGLIKYHQYLEGTHLDRRFLLTAPNIILPFIRKNWSDFSESSPDFLEKMCFLQKMSEEALFLKKQDIATDILEQMLIIYSDIYSMRKGAQHRTSQSYHKEINQIIQALVPVYKQALQIDKQIDCLEKAQNIYANGYLSTQDSIAINHLAALAQCYFENSKAMDEANIKSTIKHHQELLKRYKIFHEQKGYDVTLLKIAHTHQHLAELYCLQEFNDDNEESDKNEIIVNFQQALIYYQDYYYDDEKPTPFEIQKTRRMLGNFYKDNNEYSNAIKIYKQYLKYALKSLKPDTEDILENMGLSYFYRNNSPDDINQAIRCFTLLLERYNNSNASALLHAKAYYHLALAHQKSSKIDNEDVIQESLNNAWLKHVEHASSKPSGNYDASVLVMLMDSALAYQKTSQFELALNRFILYKQIYTDLGNNHSSFIYKKVLHTLGEIHLKLGNEAQAEKEFSEGLHIAKQGDNEESKILFIDALIAIKKAKKTRSALLLGNNKNMIFNEGQATETNLQRDQSNYAQPTSGPKKSHH